MPGLLIATMATWWLEHDILRADPRGPILAVSPSAVDALVFCLIYLAVLTLFARSAVITIVRIVPVSIAHFRRARSGRERLRRGISKWARVNGNPVIALQGRLPPGCITADPPYLLWADGSMVARPVSR